MAVEYSRGLLRIALAQMCQSLGWHAVHSTPMELLTDILERYLSQLAGTAHRYCNQCKFGEYFLCDQQGCVSK